MANALYDKGRNHFAMGDILWKASGGSSIRCCLVKAAYTPDLANHEFWTSLGANVVGNSGGATRADCPAITLADPVAGVCDSSDVSTTLTTVPGAAGACNYIAIFKDTGVDGTSLLIALIDTGTGLPITPNGGDVVITLDNGANKIFKL